VERGAEWAPGKRERAQARSAGAVAVRLAQRVRRAAVGPDAALARPGGASAGGPGAARAGGAERGRPRRGADKTGALGWWQA
jgi:hypothetical protein